MTELEKQQAKVIAAQDELLEAMEETKNALIHLCAVRNERIEVYKEMVKLLQEGKV